MNHTRRDFVLRRVALCSIAGAVTRVGAATRSSPKRSVTVSIEAFDAKGVSQGVSEISRIVKTDQE